MSYILDALRRAEAERERGAVPSLHTQQYTAAGEETTRSSRTLPWLIAAAVAVVGIGALAWKMLGADPPAAPAAQPSVLTAPAPPLTASPGASAAPMRAGAAASNAVETAAATIVTAPLAEPSPRLEPALKDPTLAPAIATRVARAASTSKATTEVPGPPAVGNRTAADALPAKPEPASSSRVYAQSELPDDVRRSLPPLSVGGASYSNDAASRMVIINGQVLHEGDRVAEGVVLKQIKLRSAVLLFRSYRFEITY